MYNDEPPTPSPKPRTSNLAFSRPPRGKRSNQDLRHVGSNRSLREADPSTKAHQSQYSDSESSDTPSVTEATVSRAPSPTASTFSVDPSTSAQHPRQPLAPKDITLQNAGEILQSLLSNTISGMNATGQLGQAFVEQQVHLQQLVDNVNTAMQAPRIKKEAALVGEEDQNQDGIFEGVAERSEMERDSAKVLLDRVALEIEEIKREQARLVRQLIDKSKTEAVATEVRSREEADLYVKEILLSGGMTPSGSAGSVATATPKATPSAKERRRQRNANAPNAFNGDSNFVLDIEKSLLVELRRLQALIIERDGELRDLRESSDHLQGLLQRSETSLKREITERTAKDAALYEIQAKAQDWDLKRSELESNVGSAESEARKLKRQLMEKIDANEGLTAANEELQIKLDEVKSKLTTANAQANAGQKQITNLKKEVEDLKEEVHQKAVHIQHSSSVQANMSIGSAEASSDAHGGQDFTNTPDGAAGRRGGGQDALTPSNSHSFDLASPADRVKRNERVDDLQTKLARAQQNVARYRKKFNELRTIHGNAAASDSSGAEDSAEEEDDFVDVPDDSAKSTIPRSSTYSRVVPRPGRKLKSMAHTLGMQPADGPSLSSEEEGQEQDDDSIDRSFSTNDESLSAGASSARASLDGFDADFADPTRTEYSSGKKKQPANKRRSTYTPAHFAAAKGSPLSKQLDLEPDESGDNHSSNHRPGSEIYEPNALGDELAGLSSGQMETEDLVGPALAEKDVIHREELAEIGKKHTALFEEQSSSHMRALADINERHRRALDGRENAHEQSIAELEKKHIDRIKATEAELQKAHETSTATMNARHAEELAQKVTEHAAALAAAEVAHKRLIGEKDLQQKIAIENKEKDQERMLYSKIRDHQAFVSEIESKHKTEIQQREAAYTQALAQRDALIKAKEEEISRLRSRLSVLENELDATKNRAQQSNERLGKLAEEMSDMKEQLTSAHSSRAEIEEKLAQVTAETAAATAAASAGVQGSISRSTSGAAVAMSDADEADLFEDAVEGPRLSKEESRAPNMERSATVTDSDGDMPKTPGDEDLLKSTAKVALAEMRDSGCQTDDEMWSRHQREHLFGSIPAAGDGKTLIGRGGLMVLGGHQSPKSNSAALPPTPTRARDSISTFGGKRDGTSVRAESPAPTMYTVGAIIGSRRSSVDSKHSVTPIHETGDPAAAPDRSKPPVMSVPPPPNMPPSSSLPIKQQRAAGESEKPPRPMSPPPSDLITRANRTLQVPHGSGDQSRPSSRTSGPPPSSFVPPGSINSASARARAAMSNVRTRKTSDAASVSSQQPSMSSRRSTGQQVRAPSAQSFASDLTSEYSRPVSVASDAAGHSLSGANGGVGGLSGTDPAVITSITQTMIGEYLYKYTRRTMGRNGHSDKRHRRYFWVHPYTKTLYWTVTDPGGASVSEAKSKSANIEDVRVVDDDNTSPPGLYHLSILVRTAARDIKITAPNRERHETWLTALGYLVNRSVQSHQQSEEDALTNVEEDFGPMRRNRERSHTNGTAGGSSVGSRRFLSPARSFVNATGGATMTNSRRRKDSDMSAASDADITPRPHGGSVASRQSYSHGTASGKRRNTAAKEYLEQYDVTPKAHQIGGKASSGASTYRSNETQPRRRPVDLAGQFFGHTSTKGSTGTQNRDDTGSVYSTVQDARLMTAEQMLEEDEENGFEGLENVRACCDGKHDVGDLAIRQHHHHHHQGTHGNQSRRKSSLGPKTSRTSTGDFSTNNKLARESSATNQASHSQPSSRISSPPPQLGPLNLNSLDPKQKRTTNGKEISSLHQTPSWFSSEGHRGDASTEANEVASNPLPNDLLATMSAASQMTPSHAPSYTDRVQQIRKARQSATTSSGK